MHRIVVMVLGLFLVACGAVLPPEPPQRDASIDADGDADADVGATVVADAGAPGDAGTASALDAGLDAGVAPADAGANNPLRLQVRDLEWAFAPIPESRCANASVTGIGVNVNPASDELLVYFVGGGACWNLATCGVGTSANLRRGYGAADFAADGIRRWSMFSRQEPRNPFRAMSHVVVPYCTADVHAGTRVTTYNGVVTVTHHGARNVDAMLPRLVATFPQVRRIVLVGSSAGGFGAQLNFPKFVASFPNVTVDVIADSAQLVNPSGTLVTEWGAAWGLTVPASCIGCATDFPRYLEHLLATSPSSRFALLASMRDSTLTPFFNYGLNVQAFNDATASVLDRYDRSSNGTYFARPGLRHTYLEFVTQLSSGEDATTFDWVSGFLVGVTDRRRP